MNFNTKKNIFYFNNVTGKYNTLWEKKINIENLKANNANAANISYYYVATPTQRDILLSKHIKNFKKKNGIKTPSFNF